MSETKEQTPSSGQRLARTKFSTQNRNRLPSLEEVLHRKTAPPVCLYNFYLFMRDREHAEEYLDFWLDVAEHEIYCKHFMKDMRKQGIDVNVMYPELARYKNSGEKDAQKQYSSSSPHGSLKSDMGSNPSSRAPSPSYIIDVLPDGTKNRDPRYRDSVRSNTTGNLSFLGRTVTREEIKMAADRIYYRYVDPDSPKEIVLSEAIRDRIRIAIQEEHRDDPGVFQEAKAEIMELMRREPFPRFLKARKNGNMSSEHIMGRLAVSIFFLCVGFSVELSLIFLDKARALRLIGFIPILIGVTNLFASQTGLSPVFVLFKISEATFFRFQRIRELYIYKLHVQRGLVFFTASLLVSLVITAIFLAVPGHRL